MSDDSTHPKIEWKEKGFSFFCNKKCEYFPCHKIKPEMEDRFNCLFCYCPLYEYEDCGGTFTDLENGWKNCTNCIFPHIKENYGMVIERLRIKRTKHYKQKQNGKDNT